MSGVTPNKIMVLDLETQNNPYYGAVASPRHPDNYVVMIGQAIEDTPYKGDIVGHRFNSKAEATNWLSIPDDVWLLVCHNAPYELDWMLVQQRQEILKFLKRGGRVFCTAVGHYLLSNQQDTYPALDAIAPQYGGSHKVDGIKILWEQGVLTADIDPELLAEYLLGPEGDIANTRKVFYGEYTALKHRGMWDMALARCEAMLANAFMMASGLYINNEVAQAQLASQQARYDELVGKFRSVREGMGIPADVEFKETSDYHMSAWLYGGPIKYRAQVPWLNDDGTPKYEKVDCYQFGETYADTNLFVDGAGDGAIQNWVEDHGALVVYKSGKNKGQPKVFKVDSKAPKTKWGELTFEMPGIVPLERLPLDIQKAFKDDYSGKRKLADGTPVYSTSKDAIDTLVLRKEFSEDVRTLLLELQEFARIDKDIGTYYLREVLDDDGMVKKVSGMLQYRTPESIIYHNLNMTATATTRLSANRPNMQNVSRGDTSDVKKMFTSRFGPDGYIIEADYRALEVVVLAAFSKDAALTKALLENIDMHCLRLSAKLQEPYESVYEKCHNKEHPDHKAYKTMRTDIKPPSFAYQYGATAMGIAFATGMPVEEAEAFIANEKALFPGVEDYFDNKVAPAVEANTSLHREQMDNGSWRMYRVGTYSAPGGTTYAFREYPKRIWANGECLDVMQFKPTQMRNYPIQGEASFFVQVACGWVVRWLISMDFFGGRAHLINTVHDAIYLDIHKDVLHEIAPTLKALMEYIPEGMKQYGYDLGLPFPAEVSFGPSMFDQTTYEGKSNE